MKKFLLFIFAILFFSSQVFAQCPNYCVPNTGNVTLTYTPQCYGENYQYEISGVYDAITSCGSYYYSWFSANGLYYASSSYSYDICYQFYTLCAHSNPYVSNDPLICGYNNIPCLVCNTTYTEQIHQSSVHIDRIPCNISLSVTSQNCSDYKCSDGEITVSVNTNACNGAYVSGGPYGIPFDYGESSYTFTGVAPGTYYFVAGSIPNGCIDTMTITIEEPPCHVAATFTTTPASGYACQDATIEAVGSSSECYQYYIWLYHIETGVTYVMWNDTRSQYSNYPNENGDHFTAAGMPPGHYDATVMSIDYVCQNNYQLEVLPECETTQWNTYTDSASYVCPLGVITSHVATNSCLGWKSELWTLEGARLFYTPILYSGDSAVYQNLFPDTFVMYTYVNGYNYYDTLCNKIDTIIIHPLNCVSPITFSAEPALALDCSDGKIIATLQDSCSDWWMTVYNSDSTVFYGEVPYWWYMQYYWPLNNEGKHELNLTLPEDTYSIRCYKGVADFDGHLHECTTWDTLTVPCNDFKFDYSIQALIQGYYIDGGLMNGPLNISSILLSDTIILSLANMNYPHAFEFTSTATLSSNGTANFSIPAYYLLQPYYLVLQHRNALETWSSEPVQLAQSANYSFIYPQSQAFGNNLFNLGDGNFAIFSGDINHDGYIDLNDLSSIETGSWDFSSGYVVPDLTGDNIVESSDYCLIENNIPLNITLKRP
ncbi:MAG: hypothetical protein ACO1G6_02495 [Bacteroidota bacterium]